MAGQTLLVFALEIFDNFSPIKYYIIRIYTKIWNTLYQWVSVVFSFVLVELGGALRFPYCVAATLRRGGYRIGHSLIQIYFYRLAVSIALL
ncbi:MAG: hypothetical protein IPK65_09600 [Gammaproteobacteria bacterium]|nr:hypothetical protein [Gammaproteobacteria bacterium]